ncbi:MAG: ribosomal RNA small subunit methyltransferase A, partial [Armatimonadetes bacterium]|nr:ribosomal RNA small subunit methyltransferase A [Armatimonadota bacterium]
EIGPGLGTLTRELAARCRTVLAVEIDARLVAVLHEETVADLPNVTVLQADALEVDLVGEARRALGPGPHRVVANIPYAITSPLVVRLLEAREAFSLIVLMVQREVADRLTAQPATEAYGALTLVAQFYAEAERTATVSRRAFWPPPEVDSAIVRLRPRGELPPVAPEAFFSVVRAAFQQRRKSLLNALAGAVGLRWSREQAAAVLAAAGIDPGRRGETLPLEEFVRLARRAGSG